MHSALGSAFTHRGTGHVGKVAAIDALTCCGLEPLKDCEIARENWAANKNARNRMASGRNDKFFLNRKINSVQATRFWRLAITLQGTSHERSWVLIYYNPASIPYYLLQPCIDLLQFRFIYYNPASILSLPSPDWSRIGNHWETVFTRGVERSRELPRTPHPRGEKKRKKNDESRPLMQ